MKNVKSLLLMLFAGILLSTSVACNKDDDNDPDNCGQGWEQSYEAELNALIEASTKYSQSQTKEDCESYKAAYRAYLNAIKDLEDCYILAGQREAFLQSVAEAEAEIELIQC